MILLGESKEVTPGDNIRELIEGLRADARDYGRMKREGHGGELLSWDQSNVRAWDAAELLETPVSPVTREVLTDDQLIELWWQTCGDEWAIPDWLMVKFGRAVLSVSPPAEAPTPIGLYVGGRQSGRSQQLIDAILAQANERGIELRLIEPSLPVEVEPLGLGTPGFTLDDDEVLNLVRFAEINLEAHEAGFLPTLTIWKRLQARAEDILNEQRAAGRGGSDE